MKTIEQELIQITKDLISIPSEFSKDSDESLIVDYIYDYLVNLKKFKVTKQLVEGNRYNIIVTTSVEPKIILFGHMDTVPKQDQTEDAFIPKIVGNKLYGLGAVDMKAGLAIMLYIAKVIKKENIGFIFTVDEEYLFKGINKLVEGYNFSPELIINLEPTNLTISNGCRGITEFEIEFQGKSVHASRKSLGVNAIEKTIEFVKNLELEIQKLDTFGKSSVNLAYLNGGTLSNYTIKASGNLVPNYSKANIEIRLGSAINTDEISLIIYKLSKELKLEIMSLKFSFSLGSFYTPKENLISFENTLNEILSNRDYKDINQTGYYEVQIIQKKWNTDILVFGPGPSEMCHVANEYLNINTLGKAYSVIASYLEKTL